LILYNDWTSVLARAARERPFDDYSVEHRAMDLEIALEETLSATTPVVSESFN
jgi:hypothetical protein